MPVTPSDWPEVHILQGDSVAGGHVSPPATWEV